MFKSLIQPAWRQAFAAWCDFSAVRAKSSNAAWRRFRYRDRIFATKPCVVDTTGLCEVHALTSSNDWRNLVWTLKTFYHFSRRTYPLTIHEDGSLREQDCRQLMAHFPGARLIRGKDSDTTTPQILQSYPRCLAFRTENTLSRKIFDVISKAQADRVLLLDSDLLFFADPTELIEAAESTVVGPNVFNADVASAYTVDPEEAFARCGVRLIPRINSGLAVLHRDSLRLDWCEEFLDLPGILSHSWRVEQTLFALMSCRYGAELLPPAYAVRLDSGGPFGPVRHYVGAVRHLMYEEGMAQLVRTGLIAALNK